MATFTKRGDGFRARIRRRGIPVQSATFDTLGAAKRWAREIESQIDRGVFRPGARDAEKTTVAAALGRYLEERTPNKKGARSERNRIVALQKHPIAQRTLAGLTGTDLAAYRDERKKAGKAPNTIRLELAIVSNLFNVARTEWGMAGLYNPIDDVALPSTKGNERDRRLAPGEEDALIAAATSGRHWMTAKQRARNPEANRGGPWWLAPAIRLALATAMRRGELVALKWSDVDLANAVAKIPRTKNGEARTVPLFPEAVAVLKAMPRSVKGRVIPVHEDNLSHAFKTAADAAGAADLRFHDLRHEATSRLVESGLFNLVEVAAITGHKTLQMLKRYAHPRAADLARRAAGNGAGPAEDGAGLREAAAGGG